MAQTDRQTDKATNFAITAYNEEILLLEDATTYPHFVKKVFGGREICPTTGKVHFQGHIQCHSQQRFSAIKKWLPTAHIEVARNVQASIQYALKDDTASGEKSEKINSKPFMTDRLIMEKLAEVCNQFCDCIMFVNHADRNTDFCHMDDKQDYWHRVRRILLDEPDLCGLLAKPDIYRLWNNTKNVWFCRKRAGHSITPRNLIISPESINVGSEAPAEASRTSQAPQQANDQEGSG